jgi:hypothetical protein
MKTIEEINEVADMRLEEAEVLSAANKLNGSLYLAGYSFELYLKAKIAERLNIPDLFHEQFKGANYTLGLSMEKSSEFRKFFMVHEYGKLFLLSGLVKKFDQDKAQEPELMKSWTCVCDIKWSEALRYANNPGLTSDQVNDFISSIKRFRQWLSRI